MKIIVCGGRNFCDVQLLDEFLDFIHLRRPVHQLIHGGANGADTLAGLWAERRGVDCIVFKADWKKWKHAAGPLRNARMILEKPDVVIAFPGGRGTENMKRVAREKGVDVVEVKP